MRPSRRRVPYLRQLPDPIDRRPLPADASEGADRRVEVGLRPLRLLGGLEGGCRGRLQAAHIVAAQVLKRVRAQALIMWQQGERRVILDTELDEILADGRNGVPACERHHHLHEGPVLHCEPPGEFFAFLAEHQLDYLYDNARSAA